MISQDTVVNAVCYFAREVVGSASPFSQHNHTCRQVIMVHSSFIECGGLARKDRTRACSRLDELESLGAYTLSSTDKGPQQGAEAAVDPINEWWNRLYWIIFHGCMLLKWGEGVLGVGEWVTGLVNQIVWQTDELWVGVSQAIWGHHRLTWGPFIAWLNCWPHHPHRKPCCRWMESMCGRGDGRTGSESCREQRITKRSYG